MKIREIHFTLNQVAELSASAEAKKALMEMGYITKIITPCKHRKFYAREHFELTEKGIQNAELGGTRLEDIPRTEMFSKKREVVQKIVEIRIEEMLSNPHPLTSIQKRILREAPNYLSTGNYEKFEIKNLEIEGTREPCLIFNEGNSIVPIEQVWW